MSEEMPETVELMRDHAVRLMALHVMVRDQEIEVRRNGFRRVPEAEDLLHEVAEELALQLAGYANG